ncbi:MAG TPA: hypothetical protein PLJ84_06660 [Bacteroidales bacterium]|nr:hypothetical protein [Bacteroidales bacterium]HPT02262.1 hypothetical protein [Bacteroidales bacterium]
MKPELSERTTRMKQERAGTRQNSACIASSENGTSYGKEPRKIFLPPGTVSKGNTASLCKK